MSCLKSFLQLLVESFFFFVEELTTGLYFDDLFSSMKGKLLESKPVHKDNETHQSTRNFTATHKTASTGSQSSRCLFTLRVADCVWILPHIYKTDGSESALMPLAYSADTVLCKQCQTSHVFHTYPRQHRQLTSFPPSAPAFTSILFPSDAPIDYVLVTSASQHKASHGDGGCHYRETHGLWLVCSPSSGFS